MYVYVLFRMTLTTDALWGMLCLSTRCFNVVHRNFKTLNQFPPWQSSLFDREEIINYVDNDMRILTQLLQIILL